MTGRIARRLLLAAFAGALAFGGSPAPSASSHSALVEMRPANGSTSSRPVTRVVLRFDGRVSSPTVIVLTETGGRVTGTTRRDPGSRIVTFTPTRPLTRGRFTVQWRIRAADGHVISGRGTFSVGSGR